VQRRFSCLTAAGLTFGILLAVGSWSPSTAQTPTSPAPDQSALPPLPATAPGPAVTSGVAAAADGSREAQLEDRIRQLETMVDRLSGQMQQRQASGGAGTSSAAASAAAVATGGASDSGFRGGTNGAPGTGGTAGTNNPAQGGGTNDPNPAPNALPGASGGTGAPGQSLPPNPPPTNRFDSPAVLVNSPGKVKFGPGFEIRTDDDEFFLQFHNLTQLDYRAYQQYNQTPVHDTFTIPRQWFMFSGRITKPWGYFVSLANGFDTISLLDVFIDYNLDPRFNLRMGRFKTPFTYEFLVEPVQGLQFAERSVFFNNFAQNRDEGIMPYGRLFDGRVDYAVGIFNGTRNGYLANGDSKFFSGYVNFKPFTKQEGSFLENLNVGGSVFSGNNNNTALIPQTLRTVVPTAGNNIVGTPFLTFNNNVRESGPQTFWDLHLAYFYKQLAIIGEYGAGFQDYALAATPANRTHLGVQSFYVQGGYLLTGETRSSIGIVKPLKPFDLRKGKRGPGAWEPVVRYQHLDISNQVFSAGLADPNLWANDLYQVDAGFNWHLTQYVKLYFDWVHSEFNNPVLFAPGRRQLTSDAFTVRLQLFF